MGGIVLDKGWSLKDKVVEEHWSNVCQDNRKEYLHPKLNAEVHQISVSYSVNCGDNNILYFGVLVPQWYISDRLIPVYPMSFSFELNLKRKRVIIWSNMSQILIVLNSYLPTS